MEYKSKYYDLDSHGPDWTREEFARTIEKLESLGMEQLAALCDHFQIRFNAEGMRPITDEDMIYALVDGVPKGDLARALGAVA